MKIIPDCPFCAVKLTYSSMSFTPKGIRHACGCMKCRRLFDLDDQYNIVRTISDQKERK